MLFWFITLVPCWNRCYVKVTVCASGSWLRLCLSCSVWGRFQHIWAHQCRGRFWWGEGRLRRILFIRLHPQTKLKQNKTKPKKSKTNKQTKTNKKEGEEERRKSQLKTAKSRKSTKPLDIIDFTKSCSEIFRPCISRKELTFQRPPRLLQCYRKQIRYAHSGSTIHHHHLFIYPLAARVVGAPQMISQPVFPIFPCSPLPSGTCWTPGLSIPWWYLPTSSSVCLVFFPLSLCLARWFWPDLMNRRRDHTTAVCVSLRWAGLRVVRLPAGSWHGLLRW